MSKPDAPSAEALKGANLKKAETHQADPSTLDPEAVKNIAGKWLGDFDSTVAQEAFKGINFKESWVETIKAAPAEEAAQKFAEGIVSGTALAE